MEDLFQIGIITGTHGLKGEVKVFPTTDDKERFLDLDTVLIDTGKELIEKKVQYCKFFKQFVFVKFEGLDDINDVEKYKRCPLKVTRENAVPLEEDEYYVADLLGLTIVDESGVTIGELVDVIETGANDVYEVKTSDGGHVLLPAIKDCILDVDMDRENYFGSYAERAGGLMNFHVLTLFPDMIEAGLHTSVTGRALQNGYIHLNAVNIRDYSKDKHKHVDDYPYGGGAGMVMQPEPIYLAYEDITQNIEKKPRVVYVTPQGAVFNQSMAEEFSKEEDLIFLCGHSRGVDERILEEIVTDYVSIGDYVLTAELPAMVMIDAVSRLVPGVLNNEESAEFESFHDNLLEHPQYTRPVEFHGKRVPDVLLSGHHGNVDKWRREQSLKRTLERRPDLLEQADLSKDDEKYLKKLKKDLHDQA